MGGGAAQHVETHPAGGALVSWRQPAPVATLLVVPGPPAQGKDGRNPDTGLRTPGSPPSELALHLLDTRSGHSAWRAVVSVTRTRIQLSSGRGSRCDSVAGRTRMKLRLP